jgi:DNA-binding protein HU-beta
MNKTTLIAEITDELNTSDDGWTKADVKRVLETFETVVVESCSKGDPVTLTGFVKFARQDRKARMGRNPATGESIKIPAKSVAKATALKKFKDAVMASAPKAKKAPAKGRRK